MREFGQHNKEPRNWLEWLAKSIIDLFTSNRFTRPEEHSERMNKRRRKTKFDRW